jgi:hypothetical protein
MRRSGCLYRLGARTLATLVAVFAALFAAELWIGGPQHLEGPAQLRWLFEPDPETGFRTAANHDGSMLEGGRRVRVRFNELGMRGPACGGKQAGETRVLFFGDSMTFGLGLEEEETFPARFAVQASRAWGRRVTAGNAAVARRRGDRTPRPAARARTRIAGIGVRPARAQEEALYQ